LGLDTAIMIYHFEGHTRYAPLTSLIFKAVADGLEAVLSSLAVMEILVKPFQSAPPKTLDGLIGQLQNMPNFSFVAAEFTIAVEAARLRAKYGLRTVDALHLATSIQGGADTFITNDKDFGRVDGKEKIKVVMLEDCV
jgi:predicted nucleic acid-binding protein